MTEDTLPTPGVAAKSSHPAPSRSSSGMARVGRMLRHRSLGLGTAIAGAVILFVVVAPLFALQNPATQNFSESLQGPSSHHWFGTDSFGRDVFSRVANGGRVTIGASIAIVVLGSTVGATLGVIAGYLGGWLGFAIMRLVDLLLSFPGILLALAVAAIMGPGLTNGILAVSIVLVPAYVRVVEGATVQIRHYPYVEAAQILGATPTHIIWHHILPNVRSSIVVLTTSWLGIAALWIAALGFLGLGVQPPTPEWGAIVNEGQQFATIAWWISVFPGAFLSLFVVGINLIGDGLRDELDPSVTSG